MNTPENRFPQLAALSLRQATEAMVRHASSWAAMQLPIVFVSLSRKGSIRACEHACKLGLTPSKGTLTAALNGGWIRFTDPENLEADRTFLEQAPANTCVILDPMIPSKELAADGRCGFFTAYAAERWKRSMTELAAEGARAAKEA